MRFRLCFLIDTPRERNARPRKALTSQRPNTVWPCLGLVSAWYSSVRGSSFAMLDDDLPK
jgi:hypothetical protein